MSASNHLLELNRLEAQEKLDAQKSHTERNRLGQFATPPPLASDILAFIKNNIPEKFKIRFMDPAFGTGAFYSALLNIFPKSRIESASGIEIDPHYGYRAEELWTQSPLNLRLEDFFASRLPSKNKPNLIVCNPPYVRHHHLSIKQKEKLQRLVGAAAMTRLNGLAGLYCYFLLYAHAWLEEDGYACWLVPSEFMDVNYGTEVKEYLLSKVTLLRVHRFDAINVQFDDALVSSAILWFKKSAPPLNHVVEFSFGGTLTKPEIIQSIPAIQLGKAAKWSRTALREGKDEENTSIRLGDLFEIKRGLATGANDFFILPSDEAHRLKLPEKFLIPILPSPRYLKQEVIEGDAKGNPLIDQKLLLLSCNLPESELKRLHPKLWDYYQIGLDRKINETYICSHRSPWYSQEFRSPAPFLCTYMGRHGAGKENPFRFILNYSKAVAANVYLLLYPKPSLGWYIKESPDSLKKIWEALGRISAGSLVAEGRVYGGGLHKLEPKELANASADSLLQSIPRLSSYVDSQEYDLFSNAASTVGEVRNKKKRAKRLRRQNSGATSKTK
ncbi:MAG: class I SAM-dependent methyltransferase [Bacteroidetes bacterium]|nr:class I SAM-dependent methyltransferase [Bacteroidota bacterium]MCL5738161.1 class I SAM-dependent methyltransferase [Bacteroidota bacterium]